MAPSEFSLKKVYVVHLELYPPPTIIILFKKSSYSFLWESRWISN